MAERRKRNLSGKVWRCTQRIAEPLLRAAKHAENTMALSPPYSEIQIVENKPVGATGPDNIEGTEALVYN